MQPRLFLSIFVLIFLAELGDKTQLAAMARAADSDGAKWTVFFAASAALVASTFIAIVLGDVLTRFIPLRYIRLAAALAFIIVGGFMLKGVLWPREEAKAEGAVEVSRATGALSRLVLTQAAAFERAAFMDYRALAERTTRPALRTLLARLAAEEETHYRVMTEAGEVLDERVDESATWPEQLPAADELMHDVAGTEERDLLQHALEHERATAAFYRELSVLSPIPSLKQTFEALAEAEAQHARELEQFLPEESGREEESV